MRYKTYIFYLTTFLYVFVLFKQSLMQLHFMTHLIQRNSLLMKRIAKTLLRNASGLDYRQFITPILGDGTYRLFLIP